MDIILSLIKIMLVVLILLYLIASCICIIRIILDYLEDFK